MSSPDESLSPDEAESLLLESELLVFLFPFRLLCFFFSLFRALTLLGLLMLEELLPLRLPLFFRLLWPAGYGRHRWVLLAALVSLVMF
jgi:hypothetical protein